MTEELSGAAGWLLVFCLLSLVAWLLPARLLSASGAGTRVQGCRELAAGFLLAVCWPFDSCRVAGCRELAAGRWWLVVGLLGCWPLCVGRDVADVAWVFGGWSVQVVWGWGRVWYDFGLGRSESDCAAI